MKGSEAPNFFFQKKKMTSLYQQANVDAAIDSKRPRTMLVAPLFLQEKGRNSEPETHVSSLYDIPLVFGDENGFRPNAKNWDDHVKNSTDPNPYIWALQLFLAFMEHMPSMGSLQCKVSKARNLNFYRKIVDLQARKRCSNHGYKISKEEERTLNGHVVMCNTFDPQFAQDVIKRSQWLIKNRGKKNGARQRQRGAAAANGSDDENDGEDLGGAAQDRADQQEDRQEEVQAAETYDEWRGRIAGEGEEEEPEEPLVFFNHWRVPGGDLVDAEELAPTGSIFERLSPHQRAGRAPWGNLFPQAVLAAAARQRPVVVAQAEGEEDDANGGYDDNITLPTVIPKMVFSITCVGPPKHAKGIIARFIIKDSALNPGIFMSHVIENRKKRGLKGHVDPFAAYSIYFNTQHPLGNHTDEDKYKRIVLGLKPELCPHPSNYIDYSYNVNMIDPESDTHFRNLLTTERALQAFEDLGVPMGSLETWYSRARATAYYPAGFLTHKTLPQQAFWYNPDYLGLLEQQFPHVKGNTRLLDCLLSGENLDLLMEQRRVLAEAHEDMDDELLDMENNELVRDSFSRAEHILRTQPVVRRRDMVNLSLVPYETNNEFVHRYTEAKRIYAKLQKVLPGNIVEVYEYVQKLKRELEEDGDYVTPWRTVFEREASDVYKESLKKYDMYRKLLNDAQDEMMKTYKTLWNPNGDIDNIPIPDQIRAMLKWWRQLERQGLKDVTRPYVQFDLNLDFFGNTQLQNLGFFITFGRVIQPMICMLLEGLFSAYDPEMRAVSFNMMLHGEKEAGKTYPGIVILKEFMCILGTVHEIHVSTRAADITDRHCYDEIMAVDECPEWMVSEVEAKKNPELVNKEKLKLVSGQVTQRTFQNIKLPSGDEFRWFRDVINDHKRATIWISNSPAESATALSSRMYRFTVKQPKISANELSKKFGEFTTGSAVLWLNLNQYLTCCLKKAAAVGAIFPTPNMELFDQIMNKVVGILEKWNADTSEMGNRTKDILAPLMRQMIDKTAVRYVFDMPFSSYYKKPFETHMIRECQRYRYAQVSQIWWVLTSCVDSILNTEDSNILTALLKISKVEWNAERGEDAYERYALDIDHKIPFRVRRDLSVSRQDMMKINNAAIAHHPQAAAAQDNGFHDTEMVDLNYIYIPGTLDGISKQLAAATVPRVAPEACRARLKKLENNVIHPPNGGHLPQPKNCFAFWHKYRTLPDPSISPEENPNGHFGIKWTGKNCPKEYMTAEERGPHNPDNTVNAPRNQQHVPAYGPDQKLPVVDLSQCTHHGEFSRLYFMPNAVKLYRQEIIIDVLTSAITCGSTRQGKYLQGFADNEDPSILSVTTLTQDNINYICDEEDRLSGYWINPENRKEIAYSDPTIPEAEWPISRRAGITFNNRGAVDDHDINKMIDPMVPTTLTKEEWAKNVRNEMSAHQEEVDVIENLDYHSARLQHLRTGQAIDEPVHDPKYMQAQYDAYMASLPAAERPIAYGRSDYPYYEQERLQRRTRKWRHASASLASKRIYDKVMADVRANSKRAWEEVRGIGPEPPQLERVGHDAQPPLRRQAQAQEGENEPRHIRAQRERTERLLQKKRK